MATRNFLKSMLAVNRLSSQLHHAGKSILRTLSTSVNKPIDVSGVFTPIATPFNVDETIAYDKLEENLTKWNTTNIKGYLIEGTNGEFALLSDQERVELVARARAFVPQHKLLLGGAGCESTRGTTLLCQQMAEAGADVVMVVTPGFFKSYMNDRTLIQHYTTVADNSPVPVLLYSVPAFAGVEFSVSAVATLSQHPNIIGLKDSAGDVTKLACFVNATKGQKFQVLVGSAGVLLPALTVGCSGGVCALGNILPEQLCRLYDLFLQSRATQGSLENNIRASSEVLQLQQQILMPNIAVTKTFGVSGLKQAMDWMNFYGGPTRTPLVPLIEKETQALRKIFVADGFLNE